MNPIAIVLIVIALIGILVLAASVKIVRPYQRGLVERLGKYKTTRDPGLNLILPFIETMQLIDMREQVVDVPPQEVITADNVVVSVDAVVYYEATDPQRLVYNVADFFTAITKLAQTNLRNLIGDLELDRALTSRDTINTQLRDVLDDATDKWGVRVVRVEIQRIDPPPDIVSAMHAQMRAERDRRATVTEAKGYQEAAIARADGEQQAAVLSAQGRKQAAVLDAEGQAQAIELRANAEKLRLELVGAGEGNAAKSRLTGIKDAQADKAVLTVEYLQALERIGDGRATKLVIPAEFSGLLGTVAALWHRRPVTTTPTTRCARRTASRSPTTTTGSICPSPTDPSSGRADRAPHRCPPGGLVPGSGEPDRAALVGRPRLDRRPPRPTQPGRVAVLREPRRIRGGPPLRPPGRGRTHRRDRPRWAPRLSAGDRPGPTRNPRGDRPGRRRVRPPGPVDALRDRTPDHAVLQPHRPVDQDRRAGRDRSPGCLLRVPGRGTGEPVRVDRRPHRQLHRPGERSGRALATRTGQRADRR